MATTIIGLLPIMFGAKTGTRVLKRIAAPMLGGLVSSAILTLIIIPVMCLLWNRFVHLHDYSTPALDTMPDAVGSGPP